jgi:hypothetical protein
MSRLAFYVINTLYTRYTRRLYHKDSRHTDYAIPDPALNEMLYKCILPLILGVVQYYLESRRRFIHGAIVRAQSNYLK